MAILQGTSLIDCLYIPDFIASGTKMVFENSNAPTSWTKDTTYNNATLRIVNGSVGNGGSTAFETVLTFRATEGTVSSIQSGVTLGTTLLTNHLTVNPLNATGTVTSSAAVTPPHVHQYTISDENFRTPGAAPRFNRIVNPTSGTAGAGGQHTHTWGPSPHIHTVPIVAPQNPFFTHGHSITETSHNHQNQISAGQDFSVYYRDVILATKD